MKVLALAAIRFYQRYLSPRKGFSCAYRVHTGGASCSGYGYEVIARHGVRGGLPLLRQRLGECATLARQRGSIDCDATDCGDVFDIGDSACECADLLGSCGRSSPTQPRQPLEMAGAQALPPRPLQAAFRWSLVALALFIVALPLPAFEMKVLGSLTSFEGWRAMVVGFALPWNAWSPVFWCASAANAVFLAAPIAFRWGAARGNGAPWIGGIAIAGIACGALTAHVATGPSSTLQIGFYVWLLAFALILVACAAAPANPSRGPWQRR